MRSLWLQDRALRVADRPIPDPPPGEARVRVLLAGICNTDLELVKGYYPFTGIPGHEFVGRVEAAPGAKAWEGKRVVGEINAVCHACGACRAGRSSHCENRTVLGILNRNGAFAEYLTLPLSNLHLVPDGVADAVALFTEPTAAALEIQEQVEVGRSHRVIVIGDGKLGNLVAQTLARSGCDLLVLGRHESKLTLLADRGIPTLLAGDPLQTGGADIVVECTGNAEGLALAEKLVRPRGTVVLKSTYHGGARVNLSSFVVNEVTLVGSRCGPFEPALRLLENGGIDVGGLVHARYSLEDGLSAFAHAERPGVMKVLLEC